MAKETEPEIAESQPQDHHVEEGKKIPEPPEKTANILSFFTFWWVNTLIALGYKRPLEHEDLWDLMDMDRVSNLIPKFEEAWELQKERAKERNLAQPSIIRTIWTTMGRRILLAGIPKFFNDAGVFVGPLLINQIVTFANDRTQPLWIGLLLAAGFFGSAFVIMSAINQVPFQIAIALTMLFTFLGPSALAGVAVMLIVIPLQGWVAKKLGFQRKQQMILMDKRVKLTNEVLQGMRIIKMYAWERPYASMVEIARSTELKKLRSQLYLKVGQGMIMSTSAVLVAFSSFAVYAVTSDVPLDAATAFTSLALFNLLNFPLMALPMVMGNAIQAFVSLKRVQTFLCSDEIDLTSVTSNEGPAGSISVTNASFSWEDEVKELTQEEQREDDLRHEAERGLEKDAAKEKAREEKRKQKEEQEGGEVIGPQHVEMAEISDTNGDKKATEVLKKGHLILSDVNFEVKPGALVMVVGSVGCGKSSLMAALLGEMRLREGQVIVNGTTAFTAQQPWILNNTVKENILFGLPECSEKYNRTIEACALQADLDVMLAGDDTEIGEKGITLSGGQKQRIALARAVYNDADIYLLDDPLSAVDSHVARHLFSECIMSMLKEKTRILCTNNLHFLDRADHILVIREGHIAEQGTFASLMKAGLDFSELVKAHTAEGEEDSEESDSMDSEGDEVAEPGIETEQIPSPHNSPPNSPTLSQVSFQGSDCENKEGPSGQVRPRRRSTKTRRRGSSAHKCCGPIVTKEVAEEAAKLQRDVLLKKQKEKGTVTAVEERERGTVKSSVMLTYAKALGGPFALILVLLASAATQGSIVAADYWLSYWTTQTTENPESAKTQLWFFLSIYATFLMGSAFLSFSRGALWTWANYRASSGMHHRLLQSVLRASMVFFETNPIGRIINRFSKDTDTIDVQLPMDLMSLLRCAMVVIFVLVMISVITPWFLIPLAPILFLYYMVSLYYRPTSRELQRLESISRSPIYNHFSETVAGIDTIRAFGQNSRFMLMNEERIDNNQRAFFARNSSNRWLDFRLQFVGASIIFFAAMLAVMARETGLNPGLVGLSITLATQVTMNLTWAVRMTAACEADFNAVERVTHYTTLPSEADLIIEDHRPPENWPDRGVVSFNKLALRYRENLPLALCNVSFSAHPGEKIGIVGRTGSGKSTLLAAFLRLVEPCEGSIEIDGIDIASIGLEDLRSRLTIIPQDPVLYSGTIRRNLDPLSKYDDESLWNSLERVQLKEVVESMEGGLLAPVQEYGENLSVGQRQLICLARALLRRSRVMMLDEATAAVDMETDRLVQETIRREFAESTVLTIAHRLNTIIDADRILVMDKGEVIEYDTPYALVSNPHSDFSKLLGEGTTAENLRKIALSQGPGRTSPGEKRTAEGSEAKDKTQ